MALNPAAKEFVPASQKLGYSTKMADMPESDAVSDVASDAKSGLVDAKGKSKAEKSKALNTIRKILAPYSENSKIKEVLKVIDDAKEQHKYTPPEAYPIDAMIDKAIAKLDSIVKSGGRKKGRKSRRASFRRMFRLYGGASIAVQTLLTKLGDVAGSSVDDDAEASILMDAELARQAKNEIVPKLEAMKAAKDSTTSSLFGKLKQGVAKLTGPAEDTASTEEVKQMLEELARDGNTTASPNDFQGYLNKINRALAFVPTGGRSKKTRRYSRRR
jgi:hypothetical protein